MQIKNIQNVFKGHSGLSTACFFGFAVFLVGFLPGCGGRKNSPVMPQAIVERKVVILEGQVLLSGASQAKQAADNNGNKYVQPVASADISFMDKSGKVSKQSAKTDQNGGFKLEMEIGSVGTLRCNKGGEGILEARIDEKHTVDPEKPNRNITPQTTLASKIYDKPLLNNMEIGELEDYIYLEVGRSKELSDKIEDSFKSNKAYEPDDDLESSIVESVMYSEEAIRKNCSETQEWCVLVSQVQARVANAEGVAKIILKRLNNKTTTANKGTVGSGIVEVLWPSPMKYAGISVDKSISTTNMRFASNGETKAGTTLLAFYYLPKDGIARSTNLFEVSLTGRMATGPEATRSVLVRHQLRGTLVEKRSASTPRR